MTPNQQINTNINTNAVQMGARGALNTAKAASTICLLAGIWLFVSAWVYGVSGRGNAFNNWIIGGLIILFSIVRIARPAYSTALTWCNIVLGIWTFCSPWIYGYAGANTGRFINSLCVGVVVVVFSIVSRRISAPRFPPTTKSAA